MLHPGGAPCRLQGVVHQRRPGGPHQLHLTAPGAAIVEDGGLGSEGVPLHRPRREQQVRVVVPLIASGAGPVKADIHRHPVAFPEPCAEAHGEAPPGERREFVGEGQLYLPSDHAVLPALGSLGSAPERFPRPGPAEERRAHHPGATGVIVDLCRAGIQQPSAGAVRGGGEGGASGPPGDGLEAQAIEGHRDGLGKRWGCRGEPLTSRVTP